MVCGASRGSPERRALVLRDPFRGVGREVVPAVLTHVRVVRDGRVLDVTDPATLAVGASHVRNVTRNLRRGKSAATVTIFSWVVAAVIVGCRLSRSACPRRREVALSASCSRRYPFARGFNSPTVSFAWKATH